MNNLQIQRRSLLLAPVFLIASIPLDADESKTVDFDRQIAPLLSSHCLECHGTAERESGLDLSRKETALEGGDSGVALTPKKLSKSLLWEKVSSDEMPPKHPLSAEKKELLRRWIEQGASWGTSPIDPYAYSTDTRAGRDWWSLQPLRSVDVPSLSTPHRGNAEDWVGGDIDRFIANRLIEKGLQPSPQADPRARVRRLYFDLIGLPPEPDVVKAFEDNPTEEAYRELVDQLLRSEHYGQRWGRHWLDIVRFGESNGFERNFARKTAWYYRDWVIDALNQDMPYTEFVRMQLYGDQLVGGIEGASATGFWVAGVHNTVVGGSRRMKLIARQDEIEEVLATVGQTFLGLTINCARCHDHKFDPISQKEFYQLASSISGLGYGEKTVASAQDHEKLKRLGAQLSKANKALLEIDNRVRKRVLDAREKGLSSVPKVPTPTAQWLFDSNFHDSVGGLKGKAVGNARLEGGALVVDGSCHVETEPLQKDTKEKTLMALVQVDTLDQRGGGAITIETRDGVIFDSIVFAEREPRRWMAGSNGFVRTDSFQGPEENEANQRPVHFAIVYQSDGTILGYRDGIPYGRGIRKSGLQSYQSGNTEFVFGLRHKPPGGNRQLKAKIFEAAFYDRALQPAEVAAAAGDPSNYVPESELVAAMSDQEKQKRASLQAQIAELDREHNETKSRADRKVYTLTAGGGATAHVLIRGDPEKVGEQVVPGAVAALAGPSADFELAAGAPEAQRRQRLTDWITSGDNALFARVIVNRLWHYHFGVGILDTPNDFGFNGGRPTHPDLLEWLAHQLIENDYQLKPIHQLIVTSKTYQQSGFVDTNKVNSEAPEIDADNRFLWRMNPRRLEAESIRDAILVASGKLNRAMGGPSFEDVNIVSNNGTVYYEPKVVDGDEFFRRTVYRFNPRGGRSALLDTFDCPDPAATAPRRAVTTTPLQALSLLNNEFVLQQSRYFAERLRKEAGDDAGDQVQRAFQIALARVPTDRETKMAIELAQSHGLETLCRALFNLNEFVIIQ